MINAKKPRLRSDWLRGQFSQKICRQVTTSEHSPFKIWCTINDCRVNISRKLTKGLEGSMLLDSNHRAELLLTAAKTGPKTTGCISLARIMEYIVSNIGSATENKINYNSSQYLNQPFQRGLLSQLYPVSTVPLSHAFASVTLIGAPSEGFFYTIISNTPHRISPSPYTPVSTPSPSQTQTSELSTPK